MLCECIIALFDHFHFHHEYKVSFWVLLGKIFNTIPTGGKMDEESMMAFMKEMKNTTELTDEEIAALAAAKIQDNKPKSRM